MAAIDDLFASLDLSTVQASVLEIGTLIIAISLVYHGTTLALRAIYSIDDSSYSEEDDREYQEREDRREMQNQEYLNSLENSDEVFSYEAGSRMDSLMNEGGYSYEEARELLSDDSWQPDDESIQFMVYYGYSEEEAVEILQGAHFASNSN